MEIIKLNIDNETINNSNYRKVLMTSSNMQVVVMSLNINETIDLEMHEYSDQFFRVEQGKCKIEIYEKLNDINPQKFFELNENEIIIIPKKTCHKVTNNGNIVLKLYTIYSPPHHAKNKINHIKESEEKYKYKISKYKHKIDLLKKIEK